VEDGVVGGERVVAFTVAWLATYALHSTLVLGLVFALSRRNRLSTQAMERALRVGLLAPLVSATIHLGLTYVSAGTMELASRLPNLAPALCSFSAWSDRMSPSLPQAAWRVAFLVWLAGVAAGFAQLMRASARFHRQLQANTPGTEATHARLGSALAAVARPGEAAPRVRLVDTLAMPVAIRGEICLPSRAIAALDDEQLRAVLAHELSHVRRRDPAWAWTSAVIRRLFFFQPLVYLAARRLHEIAECLADDDAVARTGAPVALASALACAARWTRLEVLPAPMLLSGESLALRRVRRLVTAEPSSPRVSHSLVAAVATVAACVVPALAMPGVHPTLPLDVLYTIHAADPAGPFTLQLQRGAVLAAAVDGRTLPPERILQRGTSLVLLQDDGSRFALQLTRDGGVEWEPRTARASRSLLR
jgi:beta-lactamase regulating signal transducer with metallopeptidase domain